MPDLYRREKPYSLTIQLGVGAVFFGELDVDLTTVGSVINYLGQIAPS